MLPYLFGIPMYTLCAVAGAAAGCVLFLLRMPKRLRRRAAAWLCMVAPGAFIGAKALYLLALPEGMPRPDTLLTGFVFHGGLIGGALAGLIGVKLMRLPLLRTLDAAASALAIGHGVGRIGCFCAGCCYGRTLPVIGPVPVQLMEAVCLFVLGLWLLRAVHPAREEGNVAARYCLIYAAVRFALEFLRGDGIRGFAGGLSTGQWMSLGLAGVGTALLARTSRIILMLNDTALTIDNRLLGGLLPIRFAARLYRDEKGKARLQLRLAGKELSPDGSRRTQFRFLDALPELTLHVRQLKVHVQLGIPDDAALLAYLTGGLQALLNTAGAYLMVHENKEPELSLQVKSNDRTAQLHVQAKAVLAFDTADALRAMIKTLRKQKM